MGNWFEAGHVAIVTGASRGLGKELARELLGQGLCVIVDGRDGGALEAAEKELGRLGDLVAIAGDVADPEHVRGLVAAAERRGRLDLLINNASTLGEVPLPTVEALEPQTLATLFAVNLFAPIELIRQALPLLRASGGGTIVNVTSDAAAEAYPTWGGYGATKAALEHVSRVLAAELDDTAVRVLVADPGDMNTQMHRDAIPDADPDTLRDPSESAWALLRAIAGMREPFERVRLAEVYA